MNKYFTNKHEEILSFLEDNISKLVKLKVVSRAKYKEYDEHYFKYLTADNIDDEVRIRLYSELTEDSYEWLKNKLQKALKENPGLTENLIVKEYSQLMLGEADTMPDPKFTDLLSCEDPYRMTDFVCFFSSFLIGTLKYTNESALSILTFYYCHLQNPDYDIKDMVNELTCDVRFHDAKQVKIANDIITLFCNGIPKFILKGNTSKQFS